MGATVTTGKCAAAFRSKTGEVVYVLFERTYEKNCHPHNDRWSCMALGSYAEVMRFVFLAAASCEGGMLQGRSSWIKPENYIKAWRRELAEPAIMNDVPISLKVGQGLYSTIPADQREKTAQILKKIGREDVLADIDTAVGSIVRLHDDIDVIRALFGYGQFLSPWRIIEHGNIGSVRHPELAPEIAKMGVQVPRYKALRFGQNEVLLKTDDSAWKMSGWEYSAVAKFITAVAYGQEMLCTGSATSLINEFRNLCKNANHVPNTASVEVSTGTAEVQKWHLSSYQDIACKLGIIGQDRQAPNSFTCTVGDIFVHGADYMFTMLHESQVVWDIPAQAGSQQQLQLVA